MRGNWGLRGGLWVDWGDPGSWGLRCRVLIEATAGLRRGQGWMDWLLDGSRVGCAGTYKGLSCERWAEMRDGNSSNLARLAIMAVMEHLHFETPPFKVYYTWQQHNTLRQTDQKSQSLSKHKGTHLATQAPTTTLSHCPRGLVTTVL